MYIVHSRRTRAPDLMFVRHPAGLHSPSLGPSALTPASPPQCFAPSSSGPTWYRRQTAPPFAASARSCILPEPQVGFGSTRIGPLGGIPRFRRRPVPSDGEKSSPAAPESIRTGDGSRPPTGLRCARESRTGADRLALSRSVETGRRPLVRLPPTIR